MCGLIFCEGELEETLFLGAFNTIAHRGPDQAIIHKDKHGIFGFHRLAIMDISEKGMQPFITDRLIVMCNGEIYNELYLKEVFSEYPYTSHSDCEVLLPLYLEYGKKMGPYLDAECAFVIYDKQLDIVVAGRDPIGIRPLFYGYLKETGKIAFASEAKALISICDGIKPFPIGTIYYDGEWIRYTDVKEVTYQIKDEVLALSKIKHKLMDAVKKRMMSDVPIGYLLSGGLDSSLVSAIAARYTKQPIVTFAIGMENDAIDLKYAKIVADYIGSKHYEVTMSFKDVLEALPYVIYHLETYDITTIRASLGMYLLSRYIKEKTDIKVILTGEISDELFGYKYTDFAPSAEAFQKESEKRLEELYEYDVLRADRCIAAWSLEARVPFGDLAFVKEVMSIEPELKLNKSGKGKYLLRKAFEKDDLIPESILWREKAAFSDAVGHSMVDQLKLKAEELYSEEDVKNAYIKYPHNTPFTKEALWYRDLFESHYPSMSHLISDFWMPNKEWVGSDVKDPSARALSNYGDSGK
jgi:asparagine synthase (glutamine-hydrolysing)